MKCTSCGAEIPPLAASCEYCDSSIEVTVVNGDRAFVFEHVRQSAEYLRRDCPKRRREVPPVPAGATIFPIVFSIMFIVIALVITVTAIAMSIGASSEFGAVGLIPLVMSIVPIGFVVGGFFLLGKSIRKAAQYGDAPIEARAALIVGKRTMVSGGSDDSSASTYYFVTAEFEDGAREELRPARADLFGRVTEGDAGILFSKHDLVLDFDRVAASN